MMAEDDKGHQKFQRALDAYQATGSFRKTGELLGVAKDTAWRYVQKARRLGLVSDESLDTHSAPRVEDEEVGGQRVLTGKGIRTLEELLLAAGVDESEWFVAKKVINKWDALGRGGDDGASTVVEMFQVKAWLERRPQFFIKKVLPVQAIRRAAPKGKDPLGTALIIPDSQHGFRKGRRGDLVPLHDRAACDIAVQAARLLVPDTIVLLGDMVDFAGLSSFTKEPALRFLIQPALIELHWFLQNLRLAAPQSRICYLEGSHEYRLRRVLIDRADEVADLRAVDELDGERQMSVPKLLSLDKLDIEYLGDYGEYFWLYDSIKVHHGHTAKPRGGSTVASILANATSNHIVGHIHRREHAARTIQSSPGEGAGPKRDRTTVSAMSPGCLCSLDPSVVPSRRGNPTLDWQHGLGIVNTTDRGVFMHIIPIDNGACVINGRVIEGDDRVAELRRATGVDF